MKYTPLVALFCCGWDRESCGHALAVRVKNVQSVDDAGNVTQDGEEDVDEQIRTAAAFEEDSHGWQEDCEDDLEDVAVFMSC